MPQHKVASSRFSIDQCRKCERNAVSSDSEKSIPTSTFACKCSPSQPFAHNRPHKIVVPSGRNKFHPLTFHLVGVMVSLCIQWMWKLLIVKCITGKASTLRIPEGPSMSLFLMIQALHDLLISLKMKCWYGDQFTDKIPSSQILNQI